LLSKKIQGFREDNYFKILSKTKPNQLKYYIKRINQNERLEGFIIIIETSKNQALMLIILIFRIFMKLKLMKQV